MILTLLALAYALWAFADRLGMCYVVLGAALLLAWAWWELRELPRPISRPIANKELSSVCFLLIDSAENPLFEQLLWWVLPRGICVKRFQHRVMLRDYTAVYSWPPVDYYTSAERLLRRALPEHFLVRHLLHWLFHDMPRGGMCPIDGIKTGAGSMLFGFCDYMSWFSSTKPYLYISTSNVLEMQDSDNACLAAEASCKADGALTLPGGTSGRAFNPMGDSTTQHRHARITPSNQAPLEQPDEPDVLSGSPMPKPDGNRPDETISTATAPTPMLTAEKPNKQVPRGGVQKPANVEPDYSHYDRISADGLKKILKARRISPGYYKPRLYCHDCFVYREEIKEASKKMNLAMKDYQIQDAQRNTSYGISWRRAICAFIEAKGAWYDLALKAKEHATKQCKARPENRVPRNHSREICPMRECDTQERTPPKDSAQSPASTSSSASIGLSPAGRDATAGDIAQAATQQQGPRTFDVGAAVPTQNAIDDNGAASDRMLNGQLGSSWQPRGWQPGDKPPAARAQTAAILKVTTMTPAPSLVAAASTASTAASYQVAAPSAPSNNDGAADTAALANSTSTLPTSTMVDNVLPANEATNADATPANANSAGDSTLPENNTGTPPASSTVDNAASVHITGGAVKTSSASNTSDPPGNDSVGCSTPVKPKPKRATGNPSQQDIEEAFRKKEWRPSSFGRCPHSKRGRRRQQRRNASVFKNMARVPTQQRAHTTLRKRVAALARHVGTNSGAVTGCLSGSRGRVEGDIVYTAAPQQVPTTFDAGATVPTQHTIASNGAVSYWMLYGNFGPNWRPRGWLPGDKVPRGWLPGDKPPVARTQPATTSATTSTISGSRPVAPPATTSTAARTQSAAPSANTSTIAGSRIVAPPATISTIASARTVAPPVTTSTTAGARTVAPPATTSTIAGSRTVASSTTISTIAGARPVAPPATNSTAACTQPATASAVTSTIAGSRTVAPPMTTSTVAGTQTVAPPTTISTIAGSRIVAPPANTSMTAGSRPVAPPTSTMAGARTVAPPATTSTAARTQPAAPPMTIPMIAGSRTVASPAITSSVAGPRTVAPPATTTTVACTQTTAPPATTSTTARTQPATASATTSTTTGSRTVAPPATTSMVAGSRTVAPPTTISTIAGSRTVAPPATISTTARTQPATASTTTSTTAGARTVAPPATTSTIAGSRTVAPPATTSMTTDSHPEALPATTSTTTGARPIATPIGRTTLAGTRPAAPSATISITARTQPQNNGPGQRALPRQDHKRSRKVGIEPLPEPPVNDEDTYGIHGSQELDEFKKKYLGLVENYPPARDLYLNLFSRRQRLGTRLVTDDTLRVDRIYYALLCLAIDRAVRCNSLDRLEDLFALLLEANDEVILSRYIRERRQETIHDID